VFFVLFLPTALGVATFISRDSSKQKLAKMRHLGSPANKRCVILKAGMFATVTKKQIVFR